MNCRHEIDFCIKVLRNMQIDSHIITGLHVPSDTEKTYTRLINITGHNTINIISDENMCNYIVLLLPFPDDKNIFICGPFDDFSKLSAMFYALGETLWGSVDNFRIKNHIINNGFLTETENDYSYLKYSVHVQEALTIIESDLTQDLSLKTISSNLGINESYLSALFRKETGKTLTDYINNKRIEHAKKLLRSTSIQIQTVAQYCGILDVNYFTKLFKKYTGTTPGKFRTKS